METDIRDCLFLYSGDTLWLHQSWKLCQNWAVSLVLCSTKFITIIVFSSIYCLDLEEFVLYCCESPWMSLLGSKGSAEVPRLYINFSRIYLTPMISLAIGILQLFIKELLKSGPCKILNCKTEMSLNTNTIIWAGS